MAIINSCSSLKIYCVFMTAFMIYLRYTIWKWLLPSKEKYVELVIYYYFMKILWYVIFIPLWWSIIKLIPLLSFVITFQISIFDMNMTAKNEKCRCSDCILLLNENILTWNSLFSSWRSVRAFDQCVNHKIHWIIICWWSSFWWPCWKRKLENAVWLL